MRYDNWGDLGDRIQDIIDSAVRDGDYGRLNETVRDAVESGSGFVRDILDGALGNGRSGQYRDERYGGPQNDSSRYENPQDGGRYNGGQYENPQDGGRYNGGQYENPQDGGRYNGGPYGNPQDGGGYNDPEHNARAYETRDDHGYQVPPFGRRQRTQPQPQNGLSLYRETRSDKVKGMLQTIFGGLLTAGMGLGFLSAGGAALFWGGFWYDDPWIAQPFYFSTAYYTVVGFLGVATAAGAVIFGRGLAKLGRVKRFQRYTAALGKRTYCNMESLARAVGRPVKFVKKDVKKMISMGWFPEGHVDDQETCLITSDETYRQYETTREQLAARAWEEKAAKAAQEAKKAEERVSAGTREVLDRGNEFLEKIRRSNDAIPGEEISAKISHMELIVQKIFERAKEHPEIIPDLDRLMDYYLPMTVKLLDAYEDMDSQPIQGENIRNSKKEIEDTIDTLNVAFEKLLDSIFQDTAWDLSSDISVLHTILAQEGLTEDEFAKMKREAAGAEKESK